MSQYKVIVTLTDPNAHGWKMLEASLIRHGWDYHAIVHQWTGFGSKILQTYNYLKEHIEVPYFIYLDAYDNFVLSGPSEFEYKINHLDGLVISSEKNCYPDRSLVGYFESVPHDWKFPNSGQIYGESQAYIDMIEKHPVTDEMDDQLYFTRRLLDSPKVIKQDYCNAFQSIAFANPSDFRYDFNRLYNTCTHTFPIFIHGNGKTDMTKIYSL